MKVKMILPALTEAESPFWRPIKYSLFPPLGLATLAGYCDPGDKIDVQDEEHLKFEVNYTPLSWRKRYNLVKGATHGLCHNLTQLGPLHDQTIGRSYQFRGGRMDGHGAHDRGRQETPDTGKDQAAQISDEKREG